MRIAILGYSGSGKSTLAQKLGSALGLPVQHLDAVFFTAGWENRPAEEAQAIAQNFMQQPGWVIDGNYMPLLQAERLQRASCIVYLNFNRFVCLTRAIKRFFTYRGKSRSSAAEGCDEKLDWEFVWWILHEGRNKAAKRHYREILQAYPGKCVELKTQKQVDAFAAQMIHNKK